MKEKVVRIGCYSAFWGDSISAAAQLVQQSSLDYLVADYLAEVTMGILAKRRKATSKLGGAGKGGYIAEFITFVWKPLMADIIEKKIKVVTNAGGLNPAELKQAIEQAAIDAGLEKPIVACVVGDDILPSQNDLIQNGDLKPFSQVTGSSDTEFLPQGKKLESLNAYLGALPVQKALAEGAQIVVTGRCVDSALVLGPLMHEFGWKNTDYDLLASGSLAGHIIECGCQATGGNMTDWKLSAFSENGGWANMGYPIVEVRKDGTFLVTKPEGTGGIVSVASVGEQMIYEIGDPSFYILPDVIVDFRAVSLTQVGKDKVLVKGAKGRAPTEFCKVSGIYTDGHKVTGELFIGGLDAQEKAIAVGEAIVKRASSMLEKFGMDPYRGTNIEVLGAEHTYGHNARVETREVVLRLTAHHMNKKALGLFLLEIPPSATCMAPGIIGVTTGRPRVQENMVHVSCLVRKSAINPKVLSGDGLSFNVSFPQNYENGTAPGSIEAQLDKKYQGVVASLKKQSVNMVPLVSVCYARSGDKGDSANIGVICRKPEYYPWIREVLTTSHVASNMKHMLSDKSEVIRYDLPGTYSLNFILTRCLGGGGLSSLNVDRQGKSYAQMLLSTMIPVPQSWRVSSAKSKI